MLQFSKVNNKVVENFSYKCNVSKTVFAHFITLILTFGTLHAQLSSFGIPVIKNYSVNDFKDAAGNWSIALNEKGILYFGNQYGVLEFNGSVWNIVAFPNNKSIVRSIASGPNNKMYVGGQGEIGYFDFSERGQARYYTLNNLIPAKYKNFNVVWEIHATPEGIVFQSPEAIFILNHNKIKVLEPKTYFQYSFYANNKLYAIDSKLGLLVMTEDNLLPVPNGENILKYNVVFAIPFPNNQLLLGTRNEGLWLYKNKELIPFAIPIREILSQSSISSGIELANNVYAIGTQKNGLFIINKDGKVLQHLTKQKGLQSNAIVTLKEDNQNNLWLANDIGIDFIEISSPLTYVEGANSDFGIVYSALEYYNKLFIATYSGLHTLDWNENSQPLDVILKKSFFGSIDKTVWNLQELDNKLFISYQDGSFVFDGNNLQKISHDGTWKFLRIRDSSNILLCGTYDGLQLFEKKGTKWSFKNAIKGFNETCRLIEEDNNRNIWVAHGYKGIFKIRLNQKLDSVHGYSFYNDSKGFPSSLFINVFKIRDEILFGTEKGVYYYDPVKDTMLLHPVYYTIFGNTEQVRYLKEDKNGDIWFIIGDELHDKTGILRFKNDGTFTKEHTPFQKIAGKHVPGFENISFYNNHVFIGTKNGLIHFDKNVTKNYHTEYLTTINTIHCTSKDTLIYGSILENISMHDEAQSKILKLKYKYNSLNFTFSSMFFESSNKTQYSCYLDGYDDDWNTWTTRNQKEYTNIGEGKYIFRVKARNIYGTESKETKFEFVVLPPWYRTFLFKIIYFLLIIAGLWYFNKLRKDNFERKTQKLKQQQQKELLYQEAENKRLLLEAENKMILIKKEKTESELASKTIHLIQKNEKMIELRDQIQKTILSEGVVDRKSANTLIKRINDEINDEKSWKEFEFYFNQTHQNFIHRLTEKYPELTSKDIKICAYIRLNLNSKEIASLLNISTRGMDAARLRLRKRFGLTTEQSLTKFIINF